jgi:surface-anchored protein
MKTFFPILLMSVVVAIATNGQVTNLANQHMDFSLRYDATATGSNRLNVVLRYDPGQTATNSQVYIVGGANSQLAVPSNPNFAFLGSPGSPIWILPQSQNVTLPYLGISAENIPPGIFADPMELELVSVEGPGNFFAWSVSGAGNPPNIKYIATNGVVSTQFNKATPFIGSHEHNNWGFSTNGLYRITLRANGRFLGDTTNTLGRDVSWSFQILPLRPWEHWISTNWLPATPSSTNGPAADPDGDKIVNVLEYAFGNNPNVALHTNAPAITFITENGTNYGALRYVRAKNATDLTFDARVTSVLGSASASLTNLSSVVTNGTTETITMRDTISTETATNRFYELKVKLNYP